MKKIYLIRHGESEGNVKLEWQGEDSSLTEKGQQQAQLAGARLASASVGAIVSSTMQRAKETADIIAGYTATANGVEYSDLLIECRKPAEQIGRSRGDPASIETEAQIRARFGEAGWHYSDEENFAELKARGMAVLAYLASRPEDIVTVVTHGYFMRVVLACATYGEALTPDSCLHFMTTFRTANTGMTVLMYDENEVGNPWILWTWNDQSHLEGRNDPRSLAF